MPFPTSLAAGSIPPVVARLIGTCGTLAQVAVAVLRGCLLRLLLRPDVKLSAAASLIVRVLAALLETRRAKVELLLEVVHLLVAWAFAILDLCSPVISLALRILTLCRGKVLDNLEDEVVVGARGT